MLSRKKAPTKARFPRLAEIVPATRKAGRPLAQRRSPPASNAFSVRLFSVRLFPHGYRALAAPPCTIPSIVAAGALAHVACAQVHRAHEAARGDPGKKLRQHSEDMMKHIRITSLSRIAESDFPGSLSIPNARALCTLLRRQAGSTKF